VLYGLDSAAARAEIFDPTGLGATVPHAANIRTTTGGGFGVQAVGGGGAPGDSSGSPAAGSVGSSFRPVGRNTAIYTTTVKGRVFARNRFQPTAQGPRVTEGFGLSGLGATVPHAANIRTSQHGGFGVAAIGGGGAAGDAGGSPAAGSSGSAFRTVGRNTAVFNSKGEKRTFAGNHYSPSAQGSRAIPQFGGAGGGFGLSGDRADLAPSDGVGLAGFFGWLGSRLTPPGGKIRRVQPFVELVSPVYRRRRASPPPPAVPDVPPGGPGIRPTSNTIGGPIPGGLSGDRADLAPSDGTGLSGGILGWISQRFIPPGGKLNRITPIPASWRAIVPNAIKTPLRYYGAAVQSTFFPMLSGPQQRRMFGLSPSESGVFEKWQQIMLPIDATIVTLGMTSYATGIGPFASTVTKVPYTSLAPVTFTPGQSASLIAGDFGTTTGQAAALTAPANLVVSAAPATSPGIFTAALPSTMMTPMQASAALTAGDFGATAGTNAVLAGVATTPAQAAANIAQGGSGAGAPGFLAKLGDLALAGGKFVGTTAVTTAASLALQRAMMPGGGPQDQPVGQGGVPVYAASGGPQGQQIVPMGGGSAGGGGDAGAQPELAGVGLPVMLAAGAIGVGALVMLKRRRRAKRGPR